MELIIAKSTVIYCGIFFLIVIIITMFITMCFIMKDEESEMEKVQPSHLESLLPQKTTPAFKSKLTDDSFLLTPK